MLKNISALALAFILSSCATERNYYVLSPAGPAPTRSGMGIGVGPVIMADYLVERPYIAFQSAPNRVELSEYHEWAGDLRDDFTRTLGANLGRQLGTGSIRSYPWMKESELRYQVTMDVHRFHGTAEGDALLEASWRVYALPGAKLIASRTSTLKEPLREDGFDELVAAQSRLVNQLSVKIAATIR